MNQSTPPDDSSQSVVRRVTQNSLAKTSNSSAEPTIDLHALAAEVYKLLRSELRTENERQGRNRAAH